MNSGIEVRLRDNNIRDGIDDRGVGSVRIGNIIGNVGNIVRNVDGRLKGGLRKWAQSSLSSGRSTW